MSLIYRMAGELHTRMREDFQLAVESAYAEAEKATNGYMVNKEGRSAGVRGIDLFTGSEANAYRYASEELIAHWMGTPRLTQTAFERQWIGIQGGLAAWVAAEEK